MDFSDRQMQLRKKLDMDQIDVACILKPHDITYFAGHAPVCSGVLIFPHQEPVFCTLWLDAPEAKRRCAIPHIMGYIFPRERLLGKLMELIRERKPLIKRIGVEKDFMFLRDYEALLSAYPDAEFINITPVIDRLRAIKSQEEINCIRKSAAISDKAMEAALNALRPGVKELDIAAEAEYVMKKLGSEKPAFSTFVASGNRTLLAHPIASRRKIQPGDPVVIDLGASWEGYASDICRTTFAGDATVAQIGHLRAVIEAQRAAASVIRDGAVCKDVYKAAYNAFSDHNLTKYLPDDIGYGVGLRQSEFYPIIEKDSTTQLKANMVVALLQTTAFSKKVGGIRVEDTFWIMQDGCEKLTRHLQPHLD